MQYNLAQLIAILTMPKVESLYLEWGRGTGKSTIIGAFIRTLITSMPRCTIMLVGESYQQILTRTLPSTIMGLEQHGIFQDVHYFVGRAAPRTWKWPKAYQSPDKFDRYIQFWNGSGIHLVSQDKKGDGRGLNADAQIGDEAALLSKKLLDENTTPALRGSNPNAFRDSPYMGKTIFASSTPLTVEGMWFTDMEDIAYTKPDQMRFLKADYRVNAHNLMPGFVERAKATTIPWIFNAEYLNIRPNRTQNGFYALLNEEIHTYNNYDYSHYTSVGASVDSRGDADCITNHQLILSVDFGATINCATVLQELKSINELRALKSFYVLGDNQETQDELADKIIAYYKYHQEKAFFFWYDNTGNNRTGNSKWTKAEQFANRLRAEGWKVYMMTTGGANMSHDLKHRLWEMLLRGDHPNLPAYRMNKPNCRELFISMSNAKAKTNASGGTEKDKSSERSRKIPRQLATDLSDSQDAAVCGMYIHLLRMVGGYLPT